MLVAKRCSALQLTWQILNFKVELDQLLTLSFHWQFLNETFFFTRLFDRRKSSTRLYLYWPVSRCAWAADCFYTGQSPDMQNPLMYGGGGGEGWWWGCRGGVV